MPDVEIEISVDKGDVDTALGGDKEGIDGGLGLGGQETIIKIKLGPRPCMTCALNAQSPHPRLPKLHQFCSCEAVPVRKDSILDALR